MEQTHSSALSRGEVFLIGALIGTQSNYSEVGFRARDFKFYLEVMSNWMATVLVGESISLHNNQVKRYLEHQKDEGVLKSFKKGRYQYYRITRFGLIELLVIFCRQQGYMPLENFYFVFHFIHSYRDRVEMVLKDHYPDLSPAMRVEIEDLLDLKLLKERQIHFIEKEIKKVDVRIIDSEKTSALTKKWMLEGKPIHEVVDAVEKNYPYELNSQKSLSTFLSEFRPELQRWELEEGSLRRVKEIFRPLRKHLELNLLIVQKL